MNNHRVGDYPILDKASQYLEIAEAYFNVSIGLALTSLQLQALHKEIDATLNVVKNEVPFESSVEPKLHAKKLELNSVISNQNLPQRKRKQLPTINIESLLEEIKGIKEKKVKKVNRVA